MVSGSRGRQGPRFSIRMVIWIFCSDTVFVQLNQFSQILSRQCCLSSTSVSPDWTVLILALEALSIKQIVIGRSGDNLLESSVCHHYHSNTTISSGAPSLGRRTLNQT